MFEKEYELNVIKENYSKVASLIEVKNIFKGKLPITGEDIENAILFYETKLYEVKK